ncbi:hypothetical protein BJV74DRAFT_131572 [Russula compacta]|nr:hypothetical protein BJV74DRAFT_131572 [Russula compacta]
MKRGAEKQLSKDDDADDQIEEVQTGFHIANESELAKREIRGLPKRRSPAVAAPPASAPTQPAQRFGSFSGFGAAGGATTPFTFAPSPLAVPPQKPADAPTISESASNAAKTFASFLGPSSTAGAKPVVSSSEAPKSDASGDTDEVALKYYTSLRGLNSSFLSAVSKAIESDPFVDIADILEQYKNHRISVQQDYDGKSSHAKTQSAPSPPNKPSIPAAPFSFPKPATSAPATMPVPPQSFAGFGATPSSAAPTAEPSPFSFSSAASASSDPKPAPATSSSPFSGFTGAVSSSSVFKPAASATPKEPEATPSLKPAFPLGAFAAAGPTSSAFPFGGGGTSLPGTGTLLFSNPPKASSLFGSDKDKAAPEEKDKDKDNHGPSVPTPAPFGFSLAPATATKLAEEKDKDKDKAPSLPPTSVFGGPFAKPSPFTFGSSASTTPAPFGFGVAPGGGGDASPPPKAGSVGFSFGSPSRSPSQTTTTMTTTSAPGPVFGSASTSTSTSASAPVTVAPGAAAAAAAAAAPTAAMGGTAGSTPASTAGSTPTPTLTPAAASAVPSSAATRGDTPATEGSVEEDGPARTQSPGLHAGESEGEEDEETTYTVKAKVYKFTTDREGEPTWSEMGIGMLRLKKHKKTNARRVILRSSTTGKIVINFRIYPGLQPKRTAKTVAFTGHITSPGKDTQTVQYRLRVGTEGAATELAEAMEREVRLVQTESSPST